MHALICAVLATIPFNAIAIICLLIAHHTLAAPATQPQIVTREYDVNDMLADARPDSEPDPTKTPRHATDKIGGEHPTRAESVASLLNVITETVDPDTWKENGGSVGDIREANGKLIVTQTAEGHRHLRSLLAQFRERPTTATSQVKDTTPDDEIVTRVYDIREIPVGACITLAPNQTTSRDQAIRALQKKIMTEVAPRTWNAQGGAIGRSEKLPGSSWLPIKTAANER